jgi:hypothetical protein
MSGDTRLDKLSNVRLEMSRLYRKAKTGKLDAAEASKLVYILREIRTTLEAEVIERLEQRMLNLEERVEAIMQELETALDELAAARRPKEPAPLPVGVIRQQMDIRGGHCLCRSYLWAMGKTQ